MCIQDTVGSGARNSHDDVKVIQILLNMNAERMDLQVPLAEDGQCGSHTRDAVLLFQKNVMKVDRPDGRIDPGGLTLQQLRAGIPSEFCEAKLRGIMPTATDTNI